MQLGWNMEGCLPTDSDVERLLAIEAMKDLQARRCHAVDTSDWAAYEALYAPDHVSNNDGESQPYIGGKANAEHIRKTHDTYRITCIRLSSRSIRPYGRRGSGACGIGCGGRWTEWNTGPTGGAFIMRLTRSVTGRGCSPAAG